MNLTREQAEALPMPNVPSLNRVRELEAEIQRLQAENADLRRQLFHRQVAHSAPGINQNPVQHSPPISPSVLSEGGSSIYPSPVYGRKGLRIPDGEEHLDNRVSDSPLKI